ncbi:hypothetical protein JCM33374_g1299 [Metschnikowia sp. JCM 33374]|nr:hypothetical protein JCM33374_g1299 [Metschnikowia sp. JCM 33374]
MDPRVLLRLFSVLQSFTSTWTGSYTTTETVTGADGSKSPIAVVPGAPAVTSSWTGSYTTTETVTLGSMDPRVLLRSCSWCSSCYFVSDWILPSRS